MSDWIKRSDAIEAVMAEGRKVYTSEYASAERIIHEADAVEALSMLPSAEGGDADMTVIPEGTGLMKPCPDNGADLISRQDAIRLLVDKYKFTTSEATEILSELPSAEAVQGWIPCSERLPEKDELVLVTVWDGVSIAWRNIYGGWESAEDMYEKGDVTAWMPLPKPYREESEA